MISVIIPVVNESATIGTLVSSALAHPEVEEVIVVDDGSIDDTPHLARQAGARVLRSTFLGKGASLHDGLRAAKNKTLVFLDAHLREVPPAVITQLTGPLLDKKAKLTKANCSGSLGAVCLMTARPLLRTFFPELNHLEFPLSGLWAAKRSLLQKMDFESDHSVEVGLLLDALTAEAAIQQVEIGEVDIEEEEPELLAEIADQVTRTILHKAAAQNRLKAGYLSNIEESERLAQTDFGRILQNVEPVGACRHVALFDMDGVLVRGSFIVELAYHTEKGAELSQLLDDLDVDGDTRMQKVAALFAGVPQKTFEEIAHEMPLMPGARETIATLRKAGYMVGIVADGFHVAADIIRRRVFGDFSIAHVLKYKNGKAAGRMTFAPAMSHPHGCEKHRHCKANIIRHVTDILQLPTDNVLAVGNSANDVCMLQKAGHSVAFRSTRSAVRDAANQVVEGALSDLLHALEEQLVAVTR